MFADDLLLFGHAVVYQINCVLQVLDSFCNLSGPKVNFSKSSIIFSSNVPLLVK